jgi:tRNA G18 (ribose-2'-O)-methylase SpoU
MRRVFFLNIFATLDKYVKLFEIKKMRKLENKELERKSVTAFKEATKTPLIIILDDIRSLHNIGSVFRTADAFLIEKIYLCGITAIPPNKEIHKTALGATETVAWEYQKDILNVINKLKSENVPVFAIEQVENAIFLQNFQVEKNKKYALVFGNEVYGVSQKAIELCHGSIEIPQLGTKHSLNISVSAGIVIWDLFQKMDRT